jgi:hypothetical protein
MSWRPSDAIKDCGEVESDQCPDCRHDVEDCVCPPDAAKIWEADHAGKANTYRDVQYRRQRSITR